MDTTTLPCPRRGGTALGGSQEDCGQARTAGRWGLPQAGCREALECEKLKACPRLHAHKWMFSLLLSETAPTARSLEGGGSQWGGREATVRAGPQPLAVRGCRPELGGGGAEGPFGSMPTGWLCHTPAVLASQSSGTEGQRGADPQAPIPTETLHVRGLAGGDTGLAAAETLAAVPPGGRHRVRSQGCSPGAQVAGGQAFAFSAAAGRARIVPRCLLTRARRERFEIQPPVSGAREAALGPGGGCPQLRFPSGC